MDFFTLILELCKNLSHDDKKKVLQFIKELLIKY